MSELDMVHTIVVYCVIQVKHTALIVPNSQPELVQTVFGAVSGIARLVIGPLSDVSVIRRHRLRLHQVGCPHVIAGRPSTGNS